MPNRDPEKEREYQRRYREKNRDKIRAKDRAYKKQNYAKWKACHDRYLANNPEKKKELARRYRESGGQRASQIKSRYGITAAQFDELLLFQGSVCPVCGSDFHGRKKYVDHDHATGVVRGIVHMQCNTLMGLAKDDPEILERAARYLRAAREES